ncbi:MAG: hypothetical protein M0T74_18250 [Desulfitobacterium hafniense]|nr:hypothetical protein [Desulfitobacterium hafniense]
MDEQAYCIVCNGHSIIFEEESLVNSPFINSELVNFFRVLKEKPEQFIQAFDYLLVSREIFQKYKALSIAGTSDVNRAVRFYYLLQGMPFKNSRKVLAEY